MNDTLFCGPRAIYETNGGAAEKIAELSKMHSIKSALIIADHNVYKKFNEVFKNISTRLNIAVSRFEFCGEVCECERIRLLKATAELKSPAMLISAGGGKAMDIAKLLIYESAKNRPLIVALPTAPSTCAAFSAHSVLYSSCGACERTFKPAGSLDYAILDYKILCDIEPRLFSAGFADSAAKFIEARYIFEKENNNGKIDTGAEIAFKIARYVYDNALTHAERAYQAISKKKSDPALELLSRLFIVETGMVGLYGGLKCRAAIAHAICDTISHFARRDGIYNLHGLRVGYGLMVQMAFEKRDEKEVLFLAELFGKLNIPLSLKLFELEMDLSAAIDKITDGIYNPNSTINSMPAIPGRDEIKKAFILTEERFAKRYA